MLAVWKFRLVALLLVLLVAPISLANLVVEALRPTLFALPLRSKQPPAPEQISAASLASAINPLRSDLRSNAAVGLASEVLHARPGAPSNADVQDAIKAALRVGPHDSKLWLALAMVQSRSSPANSLLTESLKMSYLTGPNSTELIPLRLDMVTASQTLSDSDLSELARSDVRALLTQLPEQQQTLVEIYQRASEIGKKFLEERVTTIDPQFLTRLRSVK